MRPARSATLSADGPTATRDRYRAYASRITGASPSYAAWAASVAEDPEAVAVLMRVAPTKRQPELVFAVARRLGADPADREALLRALRTAPDRLVSALGVATMQTNDPRRMAPVVPVLASLPGPLAILEVGVSAGLCLVPDHATVESVRDGRRVGVVTAARGPVVPLRLEVRHEPGGQPSADPGAVGASGTGVGDGSATSRSDGSGEGTDSRIDVVARVGLDPAPLDLADPTAFDRLVEAVPPEASDRIALMRLAADAVRADPWVAVLGAAPDALDRALDQLLDLVPAGATPVVLTLGTLVYLPGADRQRVVDRLRTGLREHGVRWVATERTGSLSGVAASLPDDGWLRDHGVDLRAPDAFATVSLDGRALALADAYGTTVTPLGPDAERLYGT